MSPVDIYPVAAQEKQKPSESPDFASQVIRLEDMALRGLETPNGVESFQFRVGIEIEFGLLDPVSFREALAKNEENSHETHRRFLEANPTIVGESRKRIEDDHVKRIEDSYRFQRSTIKNPDDIEGSRTDNTELLEEFKTYAEEFIKRLPAKTPEEEAKRTKWLEEVPNFGTREMINFLLYEEFSRPTLSDPTPPGDSLEAIDDYTNTQGWLEFRFGTGTLQTGYYDNEGMCEIRIAPCTPAEAIRRKEIIDNRLVEISSQFGVLVQSTSNHEHINLSMHQQKADGTYLPIIGQDEERRDATLDIASGIAEGFQNGIWLNQQEMRWDYKFDAKYGGQKLTFSPNRKSVRIVDGRLELRTTFYQADQAITWLLASSMRGLQVGHSQIAQEGYQTPEVTTIYRVHRTEKFDKHTHLEIQRAFENSQLVEENGEKKFELNSGYNMLFGEGITKALIGEQDDMRGCDIFNQTIIECIQIGEDGTPELNPDKFRSAYTNMEEKNTQYIEKFMKNMTVEDLVEKINSRLKTVKLEAVDVIAGDVHYKVDGVTEALNHIRGSTIGQLAYGNILGSVITWLEKGIPGEVK